MQIGHLQSILIWPWCKTLKQRGIFAIYDMFLESKAVFSLPGQAPKAYEQVGDKVYQVLYKQGESGRYTIRENGEVFDPQNRKTDYRVVVDPKKTSLQR